MKRSRITATFLISAFLTIALALGTLTIVGAPASAQPECSETPAWPSFAEVAPTARSIMLVRVTRSVDGIATKARLVDVMKGASPSRVDLRSLQPGPGTDECPQPSGPYAQIGDRLLVAYDGTAPGRAGSIDAVAHVGRMRDRRNISGLERLTFDEARGYDAHEPDMRDRPEDPPATPPSETATEIIRRAIPRSIRRLGRDILDRFFDASTPAPLPAPRSASPPTEAAATEANGALWSCRGNQPSFPRSALTGPTGVETMDGAVFEGLRSALETMRPEFELAPREDRPHQLPWLLAYQDEDLALFLVRRAGKSERYSAMYVNRAGDVWGFSGYVSDCQPRPLVTHGLGSSEWRVDGDSPPMSRASSFPVEIVEHACANGRPADGRISDPIVEYGEDAITITIPVRPVEGGATCPGNPWTPFVVELDEPIEDRRLLDGGPWPPEQRWPAP